MKLSTSTNLVCFRPDGSTYPLTEFLKVGSSVGFKYFDLNFYDWSRPGSPFLTDEWESWINEIAETATALGVSFGQSHAYTFDFLAPMTAADYAHEQLLVERSLRCCQIIGSKICVTHPSTQYNTLHQLEDTISGNETYFTSLGETAEQLGLKLAIENMSEVVISPKRRYCSQLDELVDLVARLQSKSIGICWDFEHADIMQIDSVSAIRKMGEKLFATHVSDSNSTTVSTMMHVLPYSSDRIDWTGIVTELKQQDYQHYFSLEVHNFINKLPDELIVPAVKFAFEMGNHIVSIE